MKNVSQFDKYLGQKILVHEEQTLIKIGKKDIPYTACTLEDGNTAISEIESQWKNVRVWLPGTVGTCDYRLDRLNVYIEKQEDGSYEIARIDLG